MIPKIEFVTQPKILSVEVSTLSPIYDIGKISRFAHGITEDQYRKDGMDILCNDVFSVAENISIDIEVFISERLARQINRHRHMAIVQKSTRYNDYKDQPMISFYVPEDNEQYRNTLEAFVSHFHEVSKMENQLVNYLLPLCTMTKVHYHMNLRTLIHMCSVRLCAQALPEFRDFLNLLKEQLEDLSMEWRVLNQLFFVPHCLQGYKYVHHCKYLSLSCSSRENYAHYYDSIYENAEFLQKKYTPEEYEQYLQYLHWYKMNGGL